MEVPTLILILLVYTMLQFEDDVCNLFVYSWIGVYFL